MDRINPTFVDNVRCNTLWKHSRLVRQKRKGYLVEKTQELPKGGVPFYVRLAVAKLLNPRKE